MGHNLHADFLPIFPLDFARLVEEEGYNRARRLKGNEHEVHGVRNFASLTAISVESQIDGTPKDLAAQPISEPIAQSLSPVPRLRIRNGDGSFSHPKHTGRNATKSCAKEGQPLSAKAIVGVETSRKGSVANPIVALSR
jgi:hypothetical protein